MDTIIKDEKKNYEKLNFEILSAQTLVATLKDSYSQVEKKLKEGTECILITSLLSGENDREFIKKTMQEREELIGNLKSQLNTTSLQNSCLESKLENGT
jgi:hypothetical protein